MGLETGNYLSDLSSTWPLSGDPVSQGDDHLRLLKKVLKQTFPGAGGAGFNTPITAKESEINYLSGLNYNLVTKIASLEVNLSAPSGTRMLFVQNTAPSGWTIDTSKHDRMLRVVDSSLAPGNTTGGLDTPIENTKVPSHTHTYSGTTAVDWPDHTHTFQTFPGKATPGSGGYWSTPSSVVGDVQTSGASNNHTHTYSGTVSAPSGTVGNWKPKYMNVIICQKT